MRLPAQDCDQLNLLKLLASTSGLSAKRQLRPGGTDGWYTYYAGYSSNFATQILTGLPIQPRSRILDPWNGSGTTTFVAARLGHDAIGIDLNPFAAVLASAKLANKEHVTNECERIFKIDVRGLPRTTRLQEDPLDAWLSQEVSSTFRHVLDQTLVAAGEPEFKDANTWIARTPRPNTSFYLFCLIRALRDLAAPSSSSNPTWFKRQRARNFSRTQLVNSFRNHVQYFSKDLIETSSNTHQILVGDARDLQTQSNSIDAVFTSPPYCTRIDYAVKTSFELAALGIAPNHFNFMALRDSLMGTTTIRTHQQVTIPPNWAASVQSLLNTIRNHQSHASGGYYFKNLWQYFDDAHRAVTEISRVLKPGALAIFIVQGSYYKDVEIDLPSLYVDIGNAANLDGLVIANYPVRNSLDKINSASRKYVDQKSYVESVVALKKRPD